MQWLTRAWPVRPSELMKDVGVDREAREAEGHECMVSWKTVEAAFQESRGITMRQCWEVKENEHQELNTVFWDAHVIGDSHQCDSGETLGGKVFLEWLQQWRGEKLEIIRKDNSFEVFLLEKKTEK